MNKKELLKKIKKATRDELFIIHTDNQFKIDRDIKEAIMERFMHLELIKLKHK